MVPLRRHQLARLTDGGWAEVLRRPWDAQARGCLVHWATHDLPLVVTRQPAEVGAAGAVALGLPAPAQWNRRRLALHVPQAAVRRLHEFPRLANMQPPAAALAGGCATARVFGSHGWQAITGLTHVRPGSDLDLWIAVDGMAHADAVAQALHACGATHPRLDGEIVFGDGAAVAWREWIEWRAGRVRAVLVKRLEGVALMRDAAWCAPAQPAQALA